MLRDLLADRGVQHVDVGSNRVVLWHAPGQVSALDTQQIPDGAEIGSFAAFAAEVGGRTLDFTRADDGRFQDQQTQSVWNLFGRALNGPLAGEQLTAVQQTRGHQDPQEPLSWGLARSNRIPTAICHSTFSPRPRETLRPQTHARL